jgi:hypothetical protein
VFLSFELAHNAFWLAVLLLTGLPYRERLLAVFLVLMLANGLEHLIWAIVVKRYVPGLVTAPWHILLFAAFWVVR